MAPWLGYGLSVVELRRGGGGAPLGAPVISGVPTISGTPAVGQVLTATPASVTGAPVITRTWQWHRNGVDIPGATSSTYTVVTADVSAFLSVTQIETNGFGFDFAVSATTEIPYSPFSNLLGYQFSIDPSVIGTLFTDTAGTVPVTAPGDLVACVRDPFTNAIVATQATSGNRPIYQVDGNGAAYLQMGDGVTARWMTGPTFDFATSNLDKTLLLVAHQIDATTGLATWAGVGLSGRSIYFFNLAGNTLTADARTTTGPSVGINLPIGTVRPVKLITAIYSSSASNVFIGRINKAQVAQSTANQGGGTIPNGPLFLGARADATQGVNGRIYGLIFAAKNSSDYTVGEVEAAENYLDARLNP